MSRPNQKLLFTKHSLVIKETECIAFLSSYVS